MAYLLSDSYILVVSLLDSKLYAPPMAVKNSEDWYSAYTFSNMQIMNMVKQNSNTEARWLLMEQNTMSNRMDKKVNEINPNVARPCLLNEL